MSKETKKRRDYTGWYLAGIAVSFLLLAASVAVQQYEYYHLPWVYPVSSVLFVLGVAGLLVFGIIAASIGDD